MLNIAKLQHQMNTAPITQININNNDVQVSNLEKNPIGGPALTDNTNKDGANLSGVAQNIMKAEVDESKEGQKSNETIGAKKSRWIQPPNKQTMRQVDGIIKHYAKKRGININLLRAVIWEESHWNPKASSFDGGHGKGLMQIDDRSKEINALTKKIGLSGFAKSKKVWDPWANVDIGTRYLSGLLKKYKNNWNKSLKHYNGSWNYPPKIRKWIAEKPWTKYM